MRDDFSQSTKDTLARRVNYLCSNPDCPVATVGPHSDPERSVNKGVAAHIAAAARLGKRYDASMTPEERSSVNNGIWLCQNCAKLVDSDDDRFTVELLRRWKADAEGKADRSILTNSPLAPATSAHQLRVRCSYVGGKRGTQLALNVFNAGTSPVYLSGWYAEWSDRSGQLSIKCIDGQLPYRLQNQDAFTLIIDVGERGLIDLERIGLADGGNQYYYADKDEIAVIKQQAQRYSVLYGKPDSSELEQVLRECEVAVQLIIENAPHGARTLVVSFTNKSNTPIPLVGGKIKWKYDPPRSQPRSQNTAGRVRAVQEIGGDINLTCRSSLSLSVASGATVQFYIHPDVADVLVELLLGDVKDSDISIVLATQTQVGWEAHGDEIPGTIREFARYLLDSRKST